MEDRQPGWHSGQHHFFCKPCRSSNKVDNPRTASHGTDTPSQALSAACALFALTWVHLVHLPDQISLRPQAGIVEKCGSQQAAPTVH